MSGPLHLHFEMKMRATQSPVFFDAGNHLAAFNAPSPNGHKSRRQTCSRTPSLTRQHIAVIKHTPVAEAA
jgi:hypothetical protein